MTNIRTSNKSGFIVRSGARRREMVWLAGAWGNATLATNSTTLLTVLTAGALALRPFTIVRTRGILWMSSDQDPPGTNENQTLIYGEIVVTEAASAAGIGSIPTLESDSASDFHVFEPMLGHEEFASAVGFQTNSGVIHRFDSKAMRKVDQGDDLVSVAEVANTPISEGVVFRDWSRALIKLH